MYHASTCRTSVSNGRISQKSIEIKISNKEPIHFLVQVIGCERSSKTFCPYEAVIQGVTKIIETLCIFL